MNISFDMLNAFVSIAECGSVSAAATSLGVPKSVISKRLAQLESHVHATLVSRSSRKLVLTPAGDLYLATLIWLETCGSTAPDAKWPANPADAILDALGRFSSAKVSVHGKNAQ